MNAPVSTDLIPTTALPVAPTLALHKGLNAAQLIEKACDQQHKSESSTKEALKLFSEDYKAGIRAWPYGTMPTRSTADKQAADAGNHAAGVRYKVATLMAKYFSIWRALAANNIALEEGDTIVSAHKRANEAGLLVNDVTGKPKQQTASNAAAEKAANAKDGAPLQVGTASADVLETLSKVRLAAIAAIEAVDGLKGPNKATMAKALDGQLRAILGMVNPYVN